MVYETCGGALWIEGTERLAMEGDAYSVATLDREGLRRLTSLSREGTTAGGPMRGTSALGRANVTNWQVRMYQANLYCKKSLVSCKNAFIV